MYEEKRLPSKHKIVVEKRERAFITGILDVMSFDEDSIETETELGIMVIKGSSLHVNSLNLEKGELEIDGEIDSFHYEDGENRSKNLLGRIFK